MVQQSKVPMLALVGFIPAGSAAVIRRWSRFLEQPSRVGYRLRNRQAMEDVTVAGLDISHARMLAQRGVLTLEALADLSNDAMAEIGFGETAMESVADWRESLATDDEGVGESNQEPSMTDIAGIGAKTAAILAAADIDTPAKLAAVPSEAISGLKLSKGSRAAIGAWREEQAKEAEDA